MIIRWRGPGTGGSIEKLRNREQGFSLVEVIIALIVATFGLLAAGQLMFIAMSSASLARSKTTAALAAGNRMESLSDLYARDQSDVNLSTGSHGPQEFKVSNPNNGSVLNHYHITWTTDTVRDPRQGKIIDARKVRITVTPIRPGGDRNYHPPLNKIISLSTILSPRMP